MSHQAIGRSSKAGAPAGLFVISGCSGGGKSTLLEALARRGMATVPEPGRRIVREELAADGKALPWHDLEAFSRRALAMAIEDRREAQANATTTIFDRGIVDAAAALERATGEPALATVAAAHPYASPVFLAPPWPELHRVEAERRNGFAEAVLEYEHLLAAYRGLGYAIVLLPRSSLDDRVAFVLETISAQELERISARRPGPAQP